MIRDRFRRRSKVAPELDITAFMNLMVILVPFLLITAVFSQITIFDLNLPPSSSSKSTPPKKELVLEVTIRKDALEVGDRNSGILKKLDNLISGYDTKSLNMFLKQVKDQYPEKLNVTILSEPDTSYETLVQIMDAVRVYSVSSGTSVSTIELFPDISIGDAPVIDNSKS